MNKYILLHQGFVPPTQEIGEAWGAWFASIEEHIVDSGSPFGPGKEISSDGVTDLPFDLDAFTGYTIINAESLDAAVEIAETNPFITAIRVYPAMAM